MAAPRIRVGIGGWTYAPWRGTFYPEGLPRRRELEYAASQLGAIEINATFYGRQAAKSWEHWASAVPDDFRFAVKGSRYVVTRPRLADAGEAIETFFGQGLEALGDRLGPILWILGAHRMFDREDLAAFFERLPDQLSGLPVRHVIEPRNESFRDERFFALCRDHDVAVVFGDDQEFPLFDADTTDFRYARLQRMRPEIKAGYEADRLEGFAARARRWLDEGQETYLFMINGAKERAPAAALALQQRLGIAPS